MKAKQGNLLQSRRRAALLSQQELADACGLSITTIQKAEHNAASVKHTTLRFICQYLGVAVEEVL